MAEAPNDAQVEAAALMWGAHAAARYAATRFPQIEGFAWRFLAARMAEIMYPFVKVAAYANLADALRDAGLADIADQIGDVARREMPGGPNEEEDKHGHEPVVAPGAADPGGRHGGGQSDLRPRRP